MRKYERWKIQGKGRKKFSQKAGRPGGSQMERANNQRFMAEGQIGTGKKGEVNCALWNQGNLKTCPMNRQLKAHFSYYTRERIS